MLIMTMVLTVYPYLITLNFNSMAQFMVLAFSYQYLVSIIENLSQMDIHVEWLRPIIDNLASKLNLAKSQTDYDAKDFNHVTGSYQGKEKDNDTKNDSN